MRLTPPSRRRQGSLPAQARARVPRRLEGRRRPRLVEEGDGAGEGRCHPAGGGAPCRRRRSRRSSGGASGRARACPPRRATPSCSRTPSRRRSTSCRARARRAWSAWGAPSRCVRAGAAGRACEGDATVARRARPRGGARDDRGTLKDPYACRGALARLTRARSGGSGGGGGTRRTLASTCASTQTIALPARRRDRVAQRERRAVREPCRWSASRPERRRRSWLTYRPGCLATSAGATSA